MFIAVVPAAGSADPIFWLIETLAIEGLDAVWYIEPNFMFVVLSNKSFWSEIVATVSDKAIYRIKLIVI